MGGMNVDESRMRARHQGGDPWLTMGLPHPQPLMIGVRSVDLRLCTRMQVSPGPGWLLGFHGRPFVAESTFSELPRGSPAEANHSLQTSMKNTILSLVAATGTLALTGCISLAIWGADEGSQAMEGSDNRAVSKTGETIQKGVKPIKKAKDDAVDAVKDAVD